MIKEDSMPQRLFARWQRGTGALLACLVLLAGVALLPGAASAATYQVRACNDSGGPNNSWAQYYRTGNTNLAFGSGCPNAGFQHNTNMGLFVRSIANGLPSPYGAFGGWRFSAPAGNNLDSIQLSDWTARTTTNSFYSMLLDDSAGREGCWQGYSICGYINGPHTVSLNNSQQVRVEVGCLSIGGCLDPGDGEGGIFEMYGATVTVNDLTAPVATPSGTLWTDGWQSGSRSIGVSGRDDADGIQGNEVKVDGQQVGFTQHTCDFTYAQPCGSHVDSWNYDTTQLSDGTHTVQAITYDAGWLADIAPRQINVDNHAPDMSGTAVAVTQGEDWTPNNSFDVSWTTPGGQVAPVAKAHYSVCHVENAADCPIADGQAVSDGVHAVSDIQVPAAGDYLVRVWLEDAAANANRAMSSVPVHLRYDPAAPGLSAPAHRNGWVNAREAKAMPQQVALADTTSVGKSGIKGYAVSADGSQPGNSVNAPGLLATLMLNDLPEGRNLIKARAISGAGVPAADSDIGTTEVDVDKTAPEASVAGAPDPSQWQRGGVGMGLVGTDQANLSGMRGYKRALDPSVKSGAYIEYSLDGRTSQAAPGDDVDGANTEFAPLAVAEDGHHTLIYKAVDLAGNESPEKTAEFKIDQTRPEVVVFEAQDSDQPSALRVAVADMTSGIAGGVVEMREQGTSAWTGLATRLAGDHLVASVDDSNLVPGTYEFQAKVLDVAGNETVSNRRRDGRVEVLDAPFRRGTRMTAGILKPGTKKQAKRVSSACRRSRKCMAKVRRQRSAAKKHQSKQSLPSGTAQTMAVPYGKSALVKGALAQADGGPVAGKPVDVYQQLDASGQKAIRIVTLRTDAAGRFDYHAPKGASRTIRFQFQGTDTLHPAQAEVKVRVPASSTIRASSHRVLNGQSVRFWGRIGRPVLGGMKIAELQAFYRDKWRTFATLRPKVQGSWAYRYRFEATSGLVTYKFRVRIRREASYPYELGYSRTTAVVVRGR